jgi:hypothetical protein
MPEAHRQAMIEVLGEKRLRPFGLDEAKEVISELSFVGRCRELGRRELVWEEWPLRHEMPPNTPMASNSWPLALP